MSIFELLTAESAKERSTILSLAVIAGLSNAGVLMLVNSVSHAPQTATAWSFFLYACAGTLAMLCTRMAGHRTNALIENALHRLKTSIIKKIENAELERLERIDTAEILDRLTENVAVISVSVGPISTIVPAACMFFFGTLYLLWLSPAACALLLPLQIISIQLYRSRNKKVLRILEERSKLRTLFLGALFDLLRGAKELRLGRARSRSMNAEYKQTSAALAKASASANKVFDDNALFITTNLYILLAALAFLLPEHIAVDGQHISKLIATILLIWSNAQALLEIYVTSIKASDALANIQNLEKRLDSARKLDASTTVKTDPWSGKLGPLEFNNVEYEYPTVGYDQPFHLGPINLHIEPGEIIFIVGGNGSGKSTLLKLLTGLYFPTSGTSTAAGQLIEANNADHHREMISAIFSDFHLFSRVYGLLDAEPSAVSALLRELHIDHKTAFRDGAFTHQKLSTGQKKRLAMVVALLEDRPLLVLDEWAADQDPEFRKYFYEEMLPALRRKGKTVVAVSHDDRYFHIADRVFTLEYGRIVSVRSKEAPPEPGLTAAEVAL